MDDIAIKVEKVSKNFALPHEKAASIKEAFINPFRSSMHKNVEVQHALKDVSFEIKKGEFFGIVGRNGSGKSTLLKMLAGIYQPTKGSITTNGKLVPFIELGVGFNPELTGRENVYLNGALLGFSEKDISDQYDDIVSFAELEKFMDQKLKNYSSGMQVRLAFSMAVRAKADILLLDEVLAVGDADFQRKCFEYFNQLKKEKTTVIFISHDMNAVREYCDRAMLIDGSRLIDIGATDNIAEQYLRLFMDNNVNEALSKKKQSRWGDQAIVASSVIAKSTAEEISVTINITAKKDFEKPVAGFRIKDDSGKEITGTNTRLEDAKLPSLNKNSTAQVVWTMPAVLRDGNYTVDIALQYPDEITVADWWNEAAGFTVKKKRHLPYPVDPTFTTKIN